MNVLWHSFLDVLNATFMLVLRLILGNLNLDALIKAAAAQIGKGYLTI